MFYYWFDFDNDNARAARCAVWVPSVQARRAAEEAARWAVFVALSRLGEGDTTKAAAEAAAKAAAFTAAWYGHPWPWAWVAVENGGDYWVATIR